MNIIPKPKNMNVGRLLPQETAVGEILFTNVDGFLLGYAAKQFNKRIVRKEWVDFLFIQLSDRLGLQTGLLPKMLLKNEEGYTLKIDEHSVFIASQSSKGLFYGIQTYLQLKQQDCDRELEIVDWPDNRMRGFHFESRFGIPKLDRMLEIIDELCKYKFNTILMELEDKFPYESVAGITSSNALSTAQLQEIIRYAGDRFMEIIPLQQTLGHVEYILKNDRYYPMREVRGKKAGGELPFSFNPIGNLAFNDIDEFCPSKTEAYWLVEKMCREMAEKYSSSKYIHIGCDEAWNLLSCEMCRERYGEEGYNKVFLEHTNRMSRFITSLNKVPIIWDDMLRGFSKEDFELLDKNIVIMCWLYYDGDFDKGASLIKKYQEAGFEIIGASSAKCCEGMSSDYLDMPNFKDRLTNIRDWSRLAAQFHLTGVVTTVWSNYTGTIAPPHPFFDTMWYPLIYSAENYWNIDSDNTDFEKRFLENYFGIKEMDKCFDHENDAAYMNFSFAADNCKRNKYTAQVYKFFSLLSIYRQKSMATNRELYKLFDGTAQREKAIVMEKVKELESMREYLKPQIGKLISIYFNEADTKEFIRSRFYMDDIVKQRLIDGVEGVIK